MKIIKTELVEDQDFIKLYSFWLCIRVWFIFLSIPSSFPIFPISFLRWDKDGKGNWYPRFLFFVLFDYYFFLFEKFNSFRVESKEEN